jgi:4-amino-4-deoxy-L-arabinose transferase-like glycosyltransferase
MAARGGFSEFTARLPAALSAIGLSVLMAALAARFFSPRIALCTGLVQATCVYMYMQGRLAELDILFAFLLAAAQGVLLWNWGSRRTSASSVRDGARRAETPPSPGSRAVTPTAGAGESPIRLQPGLSAPAAPDSYRLSLGAGAVFHVLAALAVLTKGPVALAFLGMTVLAFAAMQRSPRPLMAPLLTPGIVLFVLIAGGWHLAAYRVAGDEALYQWNYNGLQRLLGLHHLKSERFYSYLVNIPWMMLPWTIALALGARVLGRALRGPHATVHRFLWAWFLGGFVFLMLSFFKHKHYAIPILPPLSLLAAVVVDAHIAAVPVHARRFYTIGFAVMLVAFGIVGGYAVPRSDHRRETAAFVRQATSAVPAEETLHVIGLERTPQYPYIRHGRCAYMGEVDDVREALRQRKGRALWVISIRQYLDEATRHGFSFEQVAAEEPRKKQPLEKTVVVGRLGLVAGP